MGIEYLSSIIISQTLHTATRRWTFGFPWRKRQDLVRVAFKEPLVTLLKALPEKDISEVAGGEVASRHSPQLSTKSATRMLKQQ